MKKRLLSVLLVLCMVFSAVTPAVMAEGTETGSYPSTITMTGVDTEWGMQLQFKIAANGTAIAANMQHGICLLVDANVFELCNPTDGSSENADGDDIEAADDLTTEIVGAFNNMGASSVLKTFAMVDAATQKLRIVLNAQNTSVIKADKDRTMGSLGLKFKQGITVDDLDSSSIVLATREVADSASQSSIAFISETAEVTHGYAYLADGSPSAWVMDLAKPEITYTNYDAVNIHGVKVSAQSKYVNVPALLPEAEADATVAVTAAGYDNAQCTGDALSPVSFTYTIQMKDTDGETLVDAPETVSVGTDGTVTVKAGAPEGTFVVTATGSYTNSKSHTSTASGTCEIVLCHGDAQDKSDADSGDDNKKDDGSDDKKPIAGDASPAAKTLCGVEIYEVENGKETLVTSTIGGESYEKQIAVSNTDAQQITFKGTGIDQWGDSMTVEGAGWGTLTTTESGLTTSATAVDGVVTIPANADAADYTYAYTADDKTATVKIKVGSEAITWPTLGGDSTLTYGQEATTTTLPINNDGAVNSNTNTVLNVQFSWVNNQIPTVADPTVTMQCSYDDGTVARVAQTKQKQYTITVNKADRNIVTNLDESIVSNVLTLEQGEQVTLTLNTENADVENGAVDTATIAASVEGDSTENQLIAFTDDSANGTVTLEPQRLSTDSDNVTLKLTSAETDNCNAVTRTITLKVSKPTLNPTIEFSYDGKDEGKNPAYGSEITATVTENATQSGSLTSEVQFVWGYVETVEGEETFKALKTATATIADGVATVKYTPEDMTTDSGTVTLLGKKLALQVNAPKNSTSYPYIHGVQEAMDKTVGQGTQAKPTLVQDTVTTNSIKVQAVANAEYACVKATTPAPADTESTPALTWQASNEFTGLDPKTTYTVYVRLKETTNYMASEADSMEITTLALAIENTEHPDDPNYNVTMTLTVTRDAAAVDATTNAPQYGETLNANVLVPDGQFTDPALTAADFVFTWERNDESAEGGKVTLSETGSAYTLTKDDIGKTITVTAAPKAESPYGGELTLTTMTVEKADSTVDLESKKDDITGNAPTGNDTNDGSISGLPEGEYEYIKKPDNAGEDWPTEADWDSATKVPTTDGDKTDKIEPLAPGDYVIRVPETDTTKPSDPITVTVPTAGYDITGKVTSYNAALGISYELYKLGDNGQYEESASMTGNLEITPDDSGATAGAHTEGFKIEGVPAGTYKLVIFKRTHLKFTISNIKVTTANVALDELAQTATICLIAGDLNEDGRVNSLDTNKIFDPAAINKNTSAVSSEIALADADGNGLINSVDTNVVFNPDHINRDKDNASINIELP